jgi:hypothetical protein
LAVGRRGESYRRMMSDLQHMPAAAIPRAVVIAIAFSVVALGGCGERTTLSAKDSAAADSYWAAQSRVQQQTFCNTAEGKRAATQYWEIHLADSYNNVASDQAQQTELRNRAAEIVEHLKGKC